MSGKIPTTLNNNINSSSLNTSGSSSMNSSFTSSSASGMGQPVQIVDITADHKFKLNEDKLQTILNHPKARMKKVCVVSVAGAFRKGKSFLLDFFLKF